MRSLLALSFVALLAPLHASSSSVEDSELNALSARLRARNLQVDRLQRVSPHLVEVTIKGLCHARRQHHAVWPSHLL